MNLGNLFSSMWNIYFLGAVVIQLLSMLIITYRYSLLLRYFGEKIRFLDSFFVTYVSVFLSYISPAKIGTVFAKPFATKFFSRISIKKSVFATAYEQFFEFIWQAILFPILLVFVGGKFFFNNTLVEATIFLLLVILTVLAFLNYKKIIGLLWRCKKIVPVKIKSIGKKMNLTEQRVKEMMEEIVNYSRNMRILLNTFLVTVPFILIMPFAIILISAIFNIPLSYFTAFAIHWLATMVGRLSHIPGGFVSREFTSVALLVAFGVASIPALKITLLLRLTEVILVVLLGAPLSLYMLIKTLKKRRIKSLS